MLAFRDISGLYSHRNHQHMVIADMMSFILLTYCEYCPANDVVKYVIVTYFVHCLNDVLDNGFGPSRNVFIDL